MVLGFQLWSGIEELILLCPPGAHAVLAVVQTAGASNTCVCAVSRLIGFSCSGLSWGNTGR